MHDAIQSQWIHQKITVVRTLSINAETSNVDWTIFITVLYQFLEKHWTAQWRKELKVNFIDSRPIKFSKFDFKIFTINSVTSATLFRFFRAELTFRNIRLLKDNQLCTRSSHHCNLSARFVLTLRRKVVHYSGFL